MSDFLSKLAAFKTNPAVWVQALHFCIGQLVVLWAYRFHWPVIWAAGAMSGFVLLIEFWYDQTQENGQSIKEDLKDTAFYFLGIWTAYLGTF